MIPLRSLLTEAGVLGVFAIGLYVSRAYKRRWHPSEIVTMYALGLLFEVLTSYMWDYHHIFLVYGFHIDHDISVLFPLGWAGLIMTVTPLAEHCWRRCRITSWWARHLVLMGVWLVVGDISETTFYNVGMIEYVRSDSTEMFFVLGQLPYFPPTMILVGYSLLHPFVTYFFQWMERGLARSASARG